MVSKLGTGLVETLRLTCPDCSVEFDFSPPTVRFIEPGIKRTTHRLGAQAVTFTSMRSAPEILSLGRPIGD